MDTQLYFHSPILETFTMVYKEMSSRLLSEHKKLILLKKQKKINVLLADDDVDDREFFQDALHEISQINIKTVKNGVELMNELLKSTNELPDIIFLDLNMPCKNGIECLTEIKTNERLKHLPVIIYSTSSNRTDIEKCYDRGADLYVTKPYSCTELKRVTKKIFSIDWLNFNHQLRKEKFWFR